MSVCCKLASEPALWTNNLVICIFLIIRNTYDKKLYRNIHCSHIHNSPNLNTIQIISYRKLHESYLFRWGTSHPPKIKLPLHSITLREFQIHYTKHSKPETKDHIFYYSIFLKNKRTGSISYRDKNQNVFASGSEGWQEKGKIWKQQGETC